MAGELIYKKMASVAADIKGVPKDGYNQQQKFAFRSIDDTVAIVKAAMDRHGVVLAPEVIDTERWQYTTSKGSVMNAVGVSVNYTFFAEDGSSITTSMVGEASDSGDKATSKALSMALKYLFFQTFLCGTDPDPDATTVDGQAVTDPFGLTPEDKSYITELGKRAGLEKEALRQAIEESVGRQITSTADLLRTDIPAIEQGLGNLNANKESENE